MYDKKVCDSFLFIYVIYYLIATGIIIVLIFATKLGKYLLYNCRVVHKPTEIYRNMLYAFEEFR